MREYLRRYEEAGVDQVIFVLQAGRNRHEHIMESIELFGREVLPEFLERDEAARREKAKRLAPLIEAAMARKADGTHRATSATTRSRRSPRQWADATHDDALNGRSPSSPTIAPPAAAIRRWGSSDDQ